MNDRLASFLSFTAAVICGAVVTITAFSLYRIELRIQEHDEQIELLRFDHEVMRQAIKELRK